MTKKIMLINESDDESRVAIVEDNLLQEMLIEHRTKEQIKNNIYKAKVVQIQTSLQAAFVDFGNKKHGFLPNSEINVSMLSRRNVGSHAPIQKKLKEGQSILVQVTKEAVDQKGAALTMNIMLPGRFMVLMPNSNKGGVSKKIDSAEERDRLKSFLSGIDAEKHAVIIRTAGQDRNLMELKKDYTVLKKTWEDVERNFDSLDGPGLVLDEPDVINRTLRDYYTEELSEVWVDHPETFQKVLQFLKQTSPRKQKDLKLFVGDRSLFSTYKIERQVEQLTSRNVNLKSGGSIVIDQTEALVAIDVNSGKSNQEDDLDATALRTNMEAAKEVARQLRLRNLGGLIVIDFIDMENEPANRKVEEELKSSMERDKAQRKFNPISQFGLLELSRQRLNVGISNIVESDCPTCHGKGKIPSRLASTNLILRSIRETAAKGNLIKIEGNLPLELANHLLNEWRQSITDLELEFGISIVLRGDPKMMVVDESFLEPTYDGKPSDIATKQDSHKQDSHKQDFQKQDSPKKKSRRRDRHSGRKEQEPSEKSAQSSDDKKPQKKEEFKKTEPTPEAKTVESEPVLTPKTERKKVAKSTVVSDDNLNNDTTIHPHALFSNVRELEGEELEEIKSGFDSRVKGKSTEAKPRKIDSKFMWGFESNANESSGDENIDVADIAVEPADDDKKSDGTTSQSLSGEKGSGESAQADRPKRQNRKRSTKQDKTKKRSSRSNKRPAKESRDEAQPKSEAAEKEDSNKKPGKKAASEKATAKKSTKSKPRKKPETDEVADSKEVATEKTSNKKPRAKPKKKATAKKGETVAAQKKPREKAATPKKSSPKTARGGRKKPVQKKESGV